MTGRGTLLVAVLVAVLLCTGAGQCTRATAAWQKMQVVEVELQGPGKESVRLRVKHADEADEQHAGFQYICPSTIAENGILFSFPGPGRPAFHMRNVFAPLDIAFIDRDGKLVEIYLMQPYEDPRKPVYYRPGVPVWGALEMRAGFFRESGIVQGQWRLQFSKAPR